MPDGPVKLTVQVRTPNATAGYHIRLIFAPSFLESPRRWTRTTATSV
jgi:hypothetical protein